MVSFARNRMQGMDACKPLRRRYRVLAAAAMALLAAGCGGGGGGGGGGGAPIPVILDTDMGNDVDDAVALAMLHALQSQGEVRLAAVTITKASACAAPYVDLVNTFYGRPDIPIGQAVDGKTPEIAPAPAMACIPAQRTRGDGSLVYPHDLANGDAAPEAIEVLRLALQGSEDGTVVVIQVGFSTNLVHLLEDENDRALVARKVRLLAVTAGQFPSGGPEYNIYNDIPSAKALFASWPTPILVSGFEVGNTILLPASSIEHDYSYVTDHPIAEAFHLYKAWNGSGLQSFPYDRPMWDPVLALYALRPEGALYSTSTAGVVSVDGDGVAYFTASADGRHRYVVVNDAQRQATLQSIIELARRPPDAR